MGVIVDVLRISYTYGMKTSKVVPGKLTFEEVVEQYRAFLAERDWGEKQPKNYAVSISLEANELLEHYQWSDVPVGSPEELADELADILMYAVLFADCYDFDIPAAMERKM